MFDGGTDGDRRRHLLLAIDSAYQLFWRILECIRSGKSFWSILLDTFNRETRQVGHRRREFWLFETCDMVTLVLFAQQQAQLQPT